MKTEQLKARLWDELKRLEDRSRELGITELDRAGIFGSITTVKKIVGWLQ